jgi:hypothetical protein
LFPADLPDGGDYDLVFLNGCKSALVGPHSNTNAFIGKFGAKCYIGWKVDVPTIWAISFAEKFFSELDGKTSVKDAVAEAINSYAPGSDPRLQMPGMLEVIGDDEIIIDLSK